MATKPTIDFTWATDANFGSGPANGNPTKVSPVGWPAVAQGVVPGDGAAAEFMNKALNNTGDWTGWLKAGSSAGAADAHIVETDASGDTAVQELSAATVTTGSLNVTSAASLQGITTLDDKLVLNGSSAGIRYRQAVVTGGSDMDITVAADTWRFDAAPTSTRTYTVRHTGTVPQDGQRLTVTMTLASSFAPAIFEREDSTEIARINAGSNGGTLELEYDSANGWYVIGVGGAGQMTVPH